MPVNTRRRRERDDPEQFILPLAPAAATPKRSAIRTTEQAAKIAVARRAKPSVTPGHVKLTLTLDIPRDLAEQLSVRAIRESKTLEAVAIEILGQVRPT